MGGGIEAEEVKLLVRRELKGSGRFSSGCQGPTASSITRCVNETEAGRRQVAPLSKSLFCQAH